MSDKQIKPRQLYFNRHDGDLADAINQVPKGSQNHEIRKALRYWFLGEGSNTGPMTPPVSKPEPEDREGPQQKNMKVLDSIQLPSDLLR